MLFYQSIFILSFVFMKVLMRFVFYLLYGAKWLSLFTVNKTVTRKLKGEPGIMPRKGENIYKRKDGRWEGRYIKARSQTGKAVYGYVYAPTYKESAVRLFLI